MNDNLKINNIVKARVTSLIWLSLLLMAALAFNSGSAMADFTFGTPVNLGPTVNSPGNDSAPCISADGLSLYFASNRPGGFGTFDIWVARRAALDDPWTTPVNLGFSVNTSAGESGPGISAHGLTLYFFSNRSGGYGSDDLWVTTLVTARRTIEKQWSTPVNLGQVINSSSIEWGPSISSDGLSLFFHSDRPQGFGDRDLYKTTRATVDDDWGMPVNLGPIINSSASDGGASISSDDLLLFFYSDRPGGFGTGDIWLMRRVTPNAPWDIPINVGPVVNTPAGDAAPSISFDGSTIYFTSNRPGGLGDYDLWQTPIIPIVDLNSDDIVDSTDMVIMVDNWGTDNSLCDIGPMPWGDGVVDVQDLIVLAEHLFEEVPSVE